MYCRFLTTAVDEPIEFACETGPSFDELAEARVIAADMLSEALGVEVEPDDLHRYGVLFEAQVACNAAHGKRRTNADKRRAVLRLLQDEEWGAWSNREIARRCGVDDKTVGKYRREVTAENPQLEPRTYTTKHGTTATMNTGRIGKKRVEDEYEEVVNEDAA